MEFTFVAPCLFGLERALGAEMDALGLKRTDTMDGRVSFTGTMEDCAKANIGLRCAERVYLKLGQFEARSFTELFDGTAALPWEDYIGSSDAFPVKGHAVKSQLFRYRTARASSRRPSSKDCKAPTGGTGSRRPGSSIRSSSLSSRTLRPG